MNRRMAWPLVLVALSGCGPSGWDAYQFTAWRCYVQFPAEPSEESLSEETGVGPVPLTVFVVEKDGLTYRAEFGDLPPKIPFDLEDLVRSVAKRYDAKVLTETVLTVEGHQGHAFELEMTKPPSRAAGRLYVVQDHLYQLLVIGPDVHATASRAQKFLTSFRLIDPRMP